MIKRKEDAYAGRQAQGEAYDLISFGEAPAIRVKLNGSDIQYVQKGYLKRGKRKPEIESLYNHPVHQKIVGGFKVNCGGEVISIHRLDNDVALFSGARQFNGPPKSLNAILRMKF
jgi:hypothetical protein